MCTYFSGIHILADGAKSGALIHELYANIFNNNEM